MTLYENKILIATNRERPTHGYEIGQLLYDTFDQRFYRLITRNPHLWGVSDNGSVYWKTGKCEFISSNGVKGEGILADMVGLGTFARGMDANGTNNSMATGSSAIVNAGFGVLPAISSDFNGFNRTSWTPYYKLKGFVPGRVSGDVRFYSGWFRTSTGPTVGEDPLVQTDGGICFGFNATDSTWNVWHGDGTNPIIKDPITGPTIPATVTLFIMEMIFLTSTSIMINIYNGSETLLGTITVNTNVLAFGRSFNWFHGIQNPLQTNRQVHGLKLDMRVLK